MKQVLVIGAGRFGASITRNLYKMGHDVMVVDESEEVINTLSEFSTHAIKGNASDERTIKAIGVSNFDVCVIAMGSDIQASILIGIMLKEAGAKYVVAKAQSELHAKVLFKIGVDKVVFPERDMGARIAQSIVSTNIMDYIELSADYSIAEITAFDEWIGKSLTELNMRPKYGINVMAIRKGDKITVSPTASAVIEENNILIVMGLNKYLSNLDKKL
ncbi:TrkA family potassium uptake protein [Clostridiaceae bacterium 35-E11]